MATRIWFGENSFVDAENEPAEIAKQLGSPTSTAKFAGPYLFLRTTDERDVWVNPATVTYLERVQEPSAHGAAGFS